MLKRFGKDKKGVTAVEFAILAGPFLFLIFAIIESSVHFFAKQYLESTIDEAARKFRTGQFDQTVTEAQFRTALCDEVAVLFDCDKIKTDLQVAATFNALGPVQPDPVTGEVTTTFDTPGPEQIMQLTATYEWPVFTNYASALEYTENAGYSLIHVTAVIVSEPYDTN